MTTATGREGPPPVPFDYRTSRKGSLFAVYTLLDRFFGVRWFWPGKSGEVMPRRPKIEFPQVDLREKPDFAWRHFWFVRGDLAKPVVEDEVPLWYMRNRFGIAFGGPSSFAHSWTGYLEKNEHFKAHPEWYALVKGKRRPFYADKAGKVHYRGSQVCTSNPEVIAQFVRRLRRYDPKRWDIASISPNSTLR